VDRTKDTVNIHCSPRQTTQGTGDYKRTGIRTALQPRFTHCMCTNGRSTGVMEKRQHGSMGWTCSPVTGWQRV